MAVAMQQLEIVKGVLTTQRPGLDMVNLDQVMERDVKSAERTLREAQINKAPVNWGQS